MDANGTSEHSWLRNIINFEENATVDLRLLSKSEAQDWIYAVTRHLAVPAAERDIIARKWLWDGKALFQANFDEMRDVWGSRLTMGTGISISRRFTIGFVRNTRR